MANLGVLEIKQMLEDGQKLSLRKAYNILLYGGSGTGKTAITRNAVRPILFHCFDPEGYRPLIQFPTSDGIKLQETGNLIIEDFSNEDPTKPTSYLAWKKRFDELVTANFFENVGTYVLDSVTTFGAAIMGRSLALSNKLNDPRAVLGNDEYTPAKSMMYNAMRKILSLPCNIIIVAHENVDDDVSGVKLRTPAFVGTQRTQIPLLFSEVWHITSKVDAKDKFSNTAQTLTCQRITAKTRMGCNIFNVLEEPDLFKLCKKANIAINHKPSFTEIIEKGDVK